MIKSFADPRTEDVFHGIHTHAIRKDFSSALLKAAERKLDLLNCAESLDNLNVLPANKAEGVVRDGRGKYSIPIQDNWRIAFRWNDGAEDVELKS